MKTIIKYTMLDILKNRLLLYLCFFGVFFFVLAFSIQLSIKFDSGNNSTDMSKYGQLIFIHIIYFLLFMFFSIMTTNDLEDEKREGFHEITLLYMSRLRFFLAKLIAYCLFFSLFMELVTAVAIAIVRFLISTSIEWKILLALSGLMLNILFLISMIILFVLLFKSKNSGNIAFLFCLLFALLNSEIIMGLILPNSATKVIALVTPAFLNLQNEFLRFGLGMGCSSRFPIYLANFICYGGLIWILLKRQINKYECKS